MNDKLEITGCPHKTGCALFPLFRSRDALGYWMEAYCDGDHTRCARHCALQEGKIPAASLLPNGRQL